MPATVATISAASVHLASIGSRVDIAALRSSGGRISAGSGFSLGASRTAPGPVKAPMMRALKVCGLLLPFPEVGDMSTSGYRRRMEAPQITPTPPAACVHAGYGCGPANPPGRLAQLVRAQPSHG